MGSHYVVQPDLNSRFSCLRTGTIGMLYGTRLGIGFLSAVTKRRIQKESTPSDAGLLTRVPANKSL
jgi:hypothetical protein